MRVAQTRTCSSARRGADTSAVAIAPLPVISSIANASFGARVMWRVLWLGGPVRAGASAGGWGRRSRRGVRWQTLLQRGRQPTVRGMAIRNEAVVHHPTAPGSPNRQSDTFSDRRRGTTTGLDRPRPISPIGIPIPRPAPPSLHHRCVVIRVIHAGWDAAEAVVQVSCASRGAGSCGHNDRLRPRCSERGAACD
jgi:hypothetical protein